MLFALTAGGTVVCAQFIGKKDSASAAKSSAQLVMITVLAMLCLTVVFELGGGSLLGLIFGSVEQRVMADAVIYMAIPQHHSRFWRSITRSLRVSAPRETPVFRCWFRWA